MKFSENWLRSHVPTDIDRHALIDTLTDIGLEVEEVTPLGESLDNVVVARIISAERHPEADRLQVCSVDAGLKTPLQIVCGAPNARAGLRAPLALIGAQIGDLTIKKAQLRGVASHGMLCSAKELGIDDDASGLMELPENAPIGVPLGDYLGLPDASIEIKLTPNRADCFSVRGIAYDVAAACNSQVVDFNSPDIKPQTDRKLSIELNAGKDAPRYCGRIIENVDARTPTPVWMAERLRRSGIRPVSFLVDVTQYVMLELGQPMHAYDLETLTGPIGVRHARQDESLKLLDGRDAVLDEQFVLITDNDRPVGLAGLMGGWDTRVTDQTRHVFLEAAYFDPAAIMGRGRRLGLHTDAGHRFERGVDPELGPQAIAVATDLIMEYAGGKPGPIQETVLPDALPLSNWIELRRDRIERVLGIGSTDDEIERIMTALDMQLQATAEGWRVRAPSRRFDIAIEEDLIEEFARIYGYKRIPLTLPGSVAGIACSTETRLPETDVRRQMIARDYLEAINYAFIEREAVRHWALSDDFVPLANPLSEEMAIMRPNLLPGLVAALGRNRARQNERVRLFEIGKVFIPATDTTQPPTEIQRLAAAICGNADSEQWAQSARPADFFDLKGDLESLAAASGVRLKFKPSSRLSGHPGRSADIVLLDSESAAPRTVGWIGQLHPRVQKALGLDVDVFAFELDLEPLCHRTLPKAFEPSRFPSVRRDLAFVVPESISWTDIEATLRSNVGTVLRELRLFDRYSGPTVPEGDKSLAIGLILQDNSRTLTDQDVDSIMATLITALTQAHGARIRG